MFSGTRINAVAFRAGIDTAEPELFLNPDGSAAALIKMHRRLYQDARTQWLTLPGLCTITDGFFISLSCN